MLASLLPAFFLSKSLNLKTNNYYNPMKRILILAILLVTSTHAFSQIVNLTGADGRPILQEKRNDIEGSPFFSENYQKSIVYLKREPGEREAFGRLNLLTNTFEFKNGENLLEIPFIDIKKIITSDNTGVNELVFENGQNFGLDKTKLLLVLFQGGDLGFVKEFGYKLSDIQVDSYSQTEAKRKVMISENLFLIQKGKPVAVKRNLKSFSSALPSSYQKSLGQYSKENKINWKEDGDLIELLDFLSGI
jgi:hypothetical protein